MENKYADTVENKLEYKEHQDFFTKFFNIRDQLLTNLTECHLNYKQIPAAFALLNKYVLWTQSETEKFLSIDEINERIGAIIKLINNNNFIKAIAEMTNFFCEVSKYQQNAEILPKVMEEEKEHPLKDLDSKTKYALMAYDILYQNGTYNSGVRSNNVQE